MDNEDPIETAYRQLAAAVIRQALEDLNTVHHTEALNWLRQYGIKLAAALELEPDVIDIAIAAYTRTPADLYIPVTTASQLTGYHRNHITRLYRAGKIAGRTHHGRLTAVHLESLREYQAERAAQTRSSARQPQQA